MWHTIPQLPVMVCARSRSFLRTIKGRLWWSLRWWLPHHCSVPPLPPATLVGLILELCRNTSSTPIPPTKPAFLSLSLPTSTVCYLPQHNQSVKLGVRTEMLGPKSCEALASTCRLRRSLAGCLEFQRSGQSRRVRSQAEKKLKKTRAS